MGIYKAEIANMRRNIGENIGQKAIIREPISKRGRLEGKMVTIENTYRDYFMVTFDDAGRRASYNYTDLFMKTVEISINNGNDEYVPLDIPDVADRKNKLHKLSPEQLEGRILGRTSAEAPAGIA